MSGRKMSRRIADGLALVHHRERRGALRRHDALEALLARAPRAAPARRRGRSRRSARVLSPGCTDSRSSSASFIMFDGQRLRLRRPTRLPVSSKDARRAPVDAALGAWRAASIAALATAAASGGLARQRATAGRPAAGRARRRCPCCGALTRRISPRSSARKLARDREAQARAAVLAAGRAVGLLERLEDDLLLVRSGCRCRCPSPRTRPRRSRAFRSSLSALQPARRRADHAGSTSPLCVNLNAFESRLRRICCRRFASVRHRRGSRGSMRISKLRLLVSATWRKRALDEVAAARRDGPRPRRPPPCPTRSSTGRECR